MTPFKFVRYVDGKEMAEGVVIEKEQSLDAAIKRAVSLCPQRRNTVLVYVPDVAEPVGEIVEAFADLTVVSIPIMPPVGTKLYASPPKREWQGLTKTERQVIMHRSFGMLDAIRGTEYKLKEKNNG